MKICCRCEQEKPFDSFHKEKALPDGLARTCKECRKFYARRRYVANPEAFAKYREANRSVLRERNHGYYQKNKDMFKAYGAQWNRENPEKKKAMGRRAMRKRRSNPKVRFEGVISRRVAEALNGSKARRRVFALLGYSAQELRDHIESLFLPGMSWGNYGSGWHLDHKIPLVAHNYTSADHLDFRRAWALSNLQPLWASDNISKGARLTEPFQPSFAF